MNSTQSDDKNNIQLNVKIDKLKSQQDSEDDNQIANGATSPSSAEGLQQGVKLPVMQIEETSQQISSLKISLNKKQSSSPGTKKLKQVKFQAQTEEDADTKVEENVMLKTLPVELEKPPSLFRKKLNLKALDDDFEIPDNGKWTRDKTMGSGAYGKVMECIYEPLDERFAVKRFERVFENEQRGTRLLRELTILGKVDHPCLNKMITVFPPRDPSNIKDAYIVLQKCESDMKKLLKSNKFLEEIHCKSIIYDILCGTYYLHKAQICHRDLKPENILVNDDCTIQICDFGLSRSLKDLPEENNSPQIEEEKFASAENIQEITESKHYAKDQRPSLGFVNKAPKEKINCFDDMSIMKQKSDKVEMGMFNTIQIDDDTPIQTFKKSKSVVPKMLKKSMKSLTKHVVTRWYRAPEVILAQDTYNYKIDIWSVGCIFAELLSMMKENYAHFTMRQPLFPGESCRLLSPDFANDDQELKEFSEQDNKNDQLGKIFQVIGTPKPEEDLNFIKSEEAKKYLKCFKPCERVDLKELYPAVEEQGLELLNKMLQFSPLNRISAEEALKDPYFDEIRLEDEQEIFETCQIDLDFIDKYQEGELPQEELRNMITQTIQDLSKDVDEDVKNNFQ